MDLHYKQEVTVGALVLLGALLFVGGTMWLGGKTFSRTEGVHVSFEDAGTLKKGSPVKVSGVTLGNVSDIEYRGYGNVLVTLHLDPRVQPKKDAQAALATIGLVADAVIHFNPGASPQALPADTVIQGTVEKGFMDMGGELGGQAKQLLNGLNSVQFKELSDNLNKTLLSFQHLTAIYADTKNGPMSELATTMRGLQTVSARIDSVLTAAKLDQTARTADSLMGNLSRLSVDARSTAKQLDDLLGKINRNEGSLGKLMSDTTLYANAHRLIKSLQELADSIKKNPGKIGVTVKIF